MQPMHHDQHQNSHLCQVFPILSNIAWLVIVKQCSVYIYICIYRLSVIISHSYDYISLCHIPFGKWPPHKMVGLSLKGWWNRPCIPGTDKCIFSLPRSLDASTKEATDTWLGRLGRNKDGATGTKGSLVKAGKVWVFHGLIFQNLSWATSSNGKTSNCLLKPHPNFDVDKNPMVLYQTKLLCLGHVIHPKICVLCSIITALE